MPDPLLTATARYRCLSRLLVCGAAPCACHDARYRARGSVHCPFCGSETPSLELDLRGAELRARCKDGCNEDGLRGLVDGEDAPLLALYDNSLSVEHARLLFESAIAPCVAKARSYWTASKAAQMERLGFARSQRTVPALVIPIRNVHGDLATYQARPDSPRVRDGRALKYETVAGARMALDVPPAVRHILGDPTVPLFITEGARKADAAVSIGLCCIALLGVWNWRGTNEWGGKAALPDWEAIALKDAREVGREVFIAFDSDVMLKSPVYLALSRLKPLLESRGAVVRLIYLPPGECGTKVGLDDFLAAGNDVDDLLALTTDTLRAPTLGEDGSERGEGESQADMLVRLGSVGDLFSDPLGTAYGRMTVGDHRECWPIRSRGFRRWLIGAYYAETAKAPNAEAVGNALNVLEARGLFDGPVEPVYVRVAPEGDDGLYLDLGDPAWRATRVTRDGWAIVTDPPVNFIRVAGALALPEPISGGTLDELREFVNVADDEAWALFNAFLRGSLRPRGPYVVLALSGEQGSAKSTTARLARSLVDPRTPSLRAEPREARDLAIAARGSWLVGFDNISGIPLWLSDALCRLSTGGGFATRELYTDFDEALFDAQRPIVLTGITDYISRPDLLDRAVQVTLAQIPDDERRDEKALWVAFEAARPRLLGALLDDVAAALRTLPSVRLARLPRMADFALWSVAAERGRGGPTSRSGRSPPSAGGASRLRSCGPTPAPATRATTRPSKPARSVVPCSASSPKTSREARGRARQPSCWPGSQISPARRRRGGRSGRSRHAGFPANCGGWRRRCAGSVWWSRSASGQGMIGGA